MSTKDWIDISLYTFFYLYGMWRGYEKAKKKYRGW